MSLLKTFDKPSWLQTPQRLRVIISLLTSLLILLVGVTLSVGTFYQNKRTVTERVISNELTLLVDFAAVRFLSNASEAIEVSRYVASSPFVKDWLKSEHPDTLQLLHYLAEVGTGEGVVSLHVIPHNNPVIISNHWPRKKITRQEDPFYYRFIDSSRNREFNIDINKYISEQQLLFYVNNKIFGENGEVLGLADVAVSLKHFAGFIAYDTASFSGELYVVDRAGDIKLHSDSSRISFDGTRAAGMNIRNEPGLSAIAEDLLSGEVSMAEVDRDGKTILLMTRTIPEFDWLVVAEISKEEFMAPYLSMLWKNLVMSIIGSLLCIYIVLFITSRWVVKPLMRLKSGLINFFLFLNGDRGSYENLSEKGSIEMRDMAHDINNQVERIKVNIQKDQALITEMQYVIGQVNDGIFSVRLKQEAANPRLRRLMSDINHMLELLSAKVGENLNDTMASLKEYANLNFRSPPQDKMVGELGDQVYSMGRSLESALREIQSKNELLEQQRAKVDEQNQFIESRNRELSKVNAQINLINSRLESLVEEKTNHLQSAYRELDTFLYRATHDLRRPLTTLRGIIQLMQARNTDDDVAELHDLIDKVINGMDNMLKKLIAISHVSATEMHFSTLTGRHCEDLIRRVLKTFENEIREGDFTVKTQVDRALLLHVNEDLCEILLANLIENSIVFSSKVKPEVSISLFQNASGSQVLRVDDNGVGIPPNVLERCFDMFFKGSQLSQGDGLGLYVVKKVADRLKATVTLTSEVGKGTSVTVTFLKAPQEG